MQPKSAMVIAVAGNNEPRCMVDFPLPSISELELQAVRFALSMVTNTGITPLPRFFTCATP
ncbi:hypothetical protein [Candidatus Thiothrix anitrata]|uniref:Uncharacterized protein n=1 Tax=Candidatus Thiothrix anitrata TaxID=2823902 RepID=A0ABX7X832_9GAMM|nr:hypothetical protein [Candidatus Thiothrix anitrata]QTR51044.1 hypothetical protein J8380_05640 [Candidatus Thiothrix anitrata]